MPTLHSGAAISQIFSNKSMSSHIISVSGRCIRFIFVKLTLARITMVEFRKSNSCLGFFFLSIGPNYAYLPSVVKNSNIRRRPVLRMLLGGRP